MYAQTELPSFQETHTQLAVSTKYAHKLSEIDISNNSQISIHYDHQATTHTSNLDLYLYPN